MLMHLETPVATHTWQQHTSLMPASLLLMMVAVAVGTPIGGGGGGQQQQWGAVEQMPPEMEKRMLSYSDLMNNFGGPSPFDFLAPGNTVYFVDEERPKREEGEDGDEDGMLAVWKRSPALGRGYVPQRNYLMKKDEFVAPGVLRFGKRMPGVLRFGKRDPLVIQEKKAVPGVLRFGKREAGSVPGVLRFG